MNRNHELCFLGTLASWAAWISSIDCNSEAPVRFIAVVDDVNSIPLKLLERGQ